MGYLPFEIPSPPHCVPLPTPEYDTPNLPFSNTTLQLISDFLQSCDNPTLIDFLFSDDPLQVTALTNPITAGNAVPMQFSERWIAHSPYSTSSNLIKVDGNLLLAPTIILGKFIAGVGVKESVNPNPTQGNICDHFRYIGNEELKSYLVIRSVRPSIAYSASVAPEKMTLVEHFRLWNPLYRKRVTLGLDTNILHNQIKGCKPSPLLIHKALKMAQVIKEWKECETCGIAQNPTCKCIPEQQPQGPFDLSNTKSSLLAQLGAWHGIEDMHVAGKGASAFSGALGARFNFRVAFDPQLAKRLTFWAIQDCVSATTPSPTLFILKPKLDRNIQLENDLIGYFGELEDDADTKWVKEIARKQKRTGNISSPELLSLEGTDQDKTNEDNSNESTETGDVVLDAKAEKAKLRRQKNRDAARKSNHNKKIQNEKIRNELRTQLKNKARLEEIEAGLRAKNSQLRKLVSEM